MSVSPSTRTLIEYLTTGMEYVSNVLSVRAFVANKFNQKADAMYFHTLRPSTRLSIEEAYHSLLSHITIIFFICLCSSMLKMTLFENTPT